jgi:hypothetical protein
MLLTRSIKQAVFIFLNLAVLYYLLPFRPGYLYYISHHKSTSSNESPINKGGHVLISNKIIITSGDLFPKKDNSRFDFNFNIEITPSISKFVLAYTDIVFSHLQVSYSSVSSLYYTTRGPPAV